MNEDVLHAARLAQLESALSALLLAACRIEHEDDAPDRISADLSSGGCDVTYWRGTVPIAGETT